MYSCSLGYNRRTQVATFQSLAGSKTTLTPEYQSFSVELCSYPEVGPDLKLSLFLIGKVAESVLFFGPDPKMMYLDPQHCSKALLKGL